jgi:hypothetical protein
VGVRAYVCVACVCGMCHGMCYMCVLAEPHGVDAFAYAASEVLVSEGAYLGKSVCNQSISGSGSHT